MAVDRILVTGVGGGVGQSILKSFQGTRYSCVAVDTDELAAGMYAAPVAYRGLPAADPLFVDTLMAICQAERCSLMFPGLDIELPPLARAADRLRSAGITPVVSTPEVITLCDDKLATAEFLVEHGFDAPITRPFERGETSKLPLVLKPQCGGSRSMGTFVVRDERELRLALAQIDRSNCVIQEYIEGDEFTCGTVSVGGLCHGVIVMRRTLRAGDTYKAFVVRNQIIEQHVTAVANALQPFGGCNFQLRLRDGRPYIFEINARCSGTTAARSAAGFNEPKMIADYLLHGETPTYTVEEMTILRYWSELTVDTNRLDTLTRDGRLETTYKLL